jgi:serum/glucocorticoid-regulated kinase 2
MSCAFQDRENLYLVMDLLTGGDLRYHICKHRKFSEEQTSISISEVIRILRGLYDGRTRVPPPERNSPQRHQAREPSLRQNRYESPHIRGILRMTDLGIARVWKPENQ